MEWKWNLPHTEGEDSIEKDLFVAQGRKVYREITKRYGHIKRKSTLETAVNYNIGSIPNKINLDVQPNRSVLGSKVETDFSFILFATTRKKRKVRRIVIIGAHIPKLLQETDILRFTMCHEWVHVLLPTKGLSTTHSIPHRELTYEILADSIATSIIPTVSRSTIENYLEERKAE